MKVLVSPATVTFSAAGGTITFSGSYIPSTISHILHIVNITRGVIYYQPQAGSSFSGTYSSPTLTLNASTSGHADTDKLEIFIDNGNDPLSTMGDVASGSTDSGSPVKMGGKANTGIVTPVSNGQRVNAWFDEYGRIVISDKDYELGISTGVTGLRDKIVAEKCTVLADSLADGIAAFWTQTTANGGTITNSGGEGLLKTSTATNGSSQISSPTINYYPGHVAWLNSAVRFGDTGTAGNIRRIGMFTVSGTTPQEGWYYELNGTTLNAVYVKAGSATSTASGSWSNATNAPFTLDTNYHSFEIRFTAATIWFYIDNILRHAVSGGTLSAAPTGSLSLPMTVTNVKTSGATDITLAVRNIGSGRYGPQNTRPIAGTRTSVANAVSDTSLLAFNANRIGATIFNDDTAGTGATLKIALDTAVSTSSFTAAIQPQGYYEVPFGYLGPIRGIASAGTGNARITELT